MSEIMSYWYRGTSVFLAVSLAFALGESLGSVASQEPMTAGRAAIVGFAYTMTWLIGFMTAREIYRKL